MNNMKAQEILDFLIGRSINSHTSVKSIFRGIAKSKNIKLTRDQCERAIMAASVRLSEIRKEDAEKYKQNDRD